MVRFFTLLLTVLSAVQSFAQNYPKQFAQLLTEKDTTAQWQFLQKWKVSRPEDPELFIAYFNYYFSKSREVALRFNEANDEAELIEIKDSTNETIGFIADEAAFDSCLLEKGFRCIDTGINKFPARLDMRFGKIYALGQIENYEVFTSEIIKTIDIDNRNRHQWTWTDNVKVNNPQKLFLQAIQAYVVQLYNAGDEQLDRMRQVAQAVLKYYPNHVESLSNVAIAFGLQGNYDQALVALLKAEKMSPKDAVVLNNIAYMYEQKGDKPNAIKYYQLTSKLSDKETQATITQKLKKLRE